ncbi:cytochrome P450 4C1-like [Vanessa atalanta]|uniref:cytochrome P450 4C1-like n=1 Tax=Vanessa atalanta TaxID=42275 RepID=UPI001FCD2B67|nr:cytochrome P450 4C1-like [Vanessa atalanta]
MFNPEDVEILISSTKFNTKGYIYEFMKPWLNEGLILSNGEKWHQRRKILTPAFHFNILNEFNSVLWEKSNDLVKKLKFEVNKIKTDLQPYVTDLSLNSVCETAMGISLDKEASNFSKTYKSAVHKLGSYLFYRIQKIWLYPNKIFSISPVGRDQIYLLDLLSSFRNKVIAKRIESSDDRKICTDKVNDDCNSVDDTIGTKKKRLAMLDLLLESEKEGKIDREGIHEEVDTFMFAGYDTTATALQYAFMLLANHKEAQDTILEESAQILNSPDSKPTMNDLSQMKYLEACIKETLRLYPPVHFISRQSDQPVQFTKYKCPPGTNYVIVIYELHRRSDQYEEPLEFRPERFLKPPTWHPFSYIPFSAGPRNCIGQKFAMLEMKMAILAVLREYRLLPVTKPDDIVIYMDMILRSTEPIYVKFEKRTV